MTEAVGIGLTVSLVAACVALAAIGVGLGSIWRDYVRRSDSQVGAASELATLRIQHANAQAELAQVKADRDKHKADAAKLAADLKEAQANAVLTASDQDAIDMANGRR